MRSPSRQRHPAAELGLYDYRNRFYDPILGRFVQSDPIGFAAGDANFFSYCGGDPVNYTDPSGTTVRFSGDRAAINSAINYLSGSPTFSSIYSGLQSSSLAGHAHNWDTNPGKYEADRDTDAGVYDNMEEYHAGQTETKIAEELGEATRVRIIVVKLYL